MYPEKPIGELQTEAAEEPQFEHPNDRLALHTHKQSCGIVVRSKPQPLGFCQRVLGVRCIQKTPRQHCIPRNNCFCCNTGCLRPSKSVFRGYARPVASHGSCCRVVARPGPVLLLKSTEQQCSGDTNMPGPGSVHMADADDIIEILSSEDGDDCKDSDQQASMSEGSDEYNYSSDEDPSDDLGEEPRPVSVSEKKAPYRIIDSEALKQVQVCGENCPAGSSACTSPVLAWMPNLG